MSLSPSNNQLLRDTAYVRHSPPSSRCTPVTLRLYERSPTILQRLVYSQPCGRSMVVSNQDYNVLTTVGYQYHNGSTVKTPYSLESLKPGVQWAVEEMQRT